MASALTAPLPGPESAARGQFAERAYAHLKQQLLEGGLEAGEEISVEATSRALAISRQPVRDAVKRLEAEGLVQIIAQVGCRAVRPAPTEVADFFALFAAAEGVIAGFAATRRSEAEAVEFRKLADEVARLAREGGPPPARDPLYRRLNRIFHGRVHAMARSPMSAAIAASFWDRSDYILRVAHGSLYFSSAVRQAHRAIRDAIVDGDGAAARAAVGRHLTEVGRLAAQRLQQAV